MIQSAVDRLVDNYLGAVAAAGADLPPSQRDELLGDLREHIAAQLGGSATEADLRTILDRLGDPAAIAAEARVGQPTGPRPVVVPRPVAVQRGPAAGAIAMVGAAAASVVVVLAIVAGLLLVLLRA